MLGAIGVVQLDHEVDMAAATAAAVREGVWLRPFRDLVYTMPPYVTGDADVARIARAVCAAARGGMTMPVLVITGTGTEVGKTVATAAVAATALAAGRSVAVLKPAQTGVRPDERGDADEVARLAGAVTDRSNSPAIPSRWPPRRPPAGPALPPVRPAEVAEAAAKLAAEHDLVLVEGAGGLLVRFDDEGGTLADAARLLDAPVLVVASAGLGTLNTTELTARELRAAETGLAGCRHRQLAATRRTWRPAATWPTCRRSPGHPCSGRCPQGRGRSRPADFRDGGGRVGWRRGWAAHGTRRRSAARRSLAGLPRLHEESVTRSVRVVREGRPVHGGDLAGWFWSCG